MPTASQQIKQTPFLRVLKTAEQLANQFIIVRGVYGSETAATRLLQDCDENYEKPANVMAIVRLKDAAIKSRRAK